MIPKVMVFLCALTLVLFPGCPGSSSTGPGGVPGVPQAPTGLAVTSVSSNQIMVSWTDNSADEDGFNVFRAGASPDTFRAVAVTASDITSYTDTGLVASTPYRYRVSAFNGNGASSFSNDLDVTTETPPVPLIQLTAGQSWKYSLDYEYGFIAYYGSSNIHIVGERLVYVERQLQYQGRDAARVCAFTRGTSSTDTTFEASIMYLATAPSSLLKWLSSGWHEILSSSSPNNNNTFFFAGGPANDGPNIQSASSVTVPAGTFTTTRVEHHFKQDGPYDNVWITEDQWEHYASGTGLVRSQWRIEIDDKDPMAADSWNRGTMQLESGTPAIGMEAEPNDEGTNTMPQIATLPAIRICDIDMGDAGEIMTDTLVNPNKNGARIIQDWYRFYAEAGHSLIINLTFDNADADPDVYLFRLIPGVAPGSFSRSYVASSVRPKGRNELIRLTIGRSANYLIGIQAWETTVRSTYWMSVR